MIQNIAVVTPKMRSGERGGAEALYAGLVGNLRRAGYAADQIEVVVDESSFEAVLASYLTCFELDLSDYDLVISTKAPTYLVQHRNHVSYLLHTIRVFYDMFEREYGAGTPEQRRQRSLIHALDQRALHPDRVRRHFANGHQTYLRLHEIDPFWRGVDFRALHHPPALDRFQEPRPGRYVFLPSRLHRWKRADLVIEAFRYLHKDIGLKISGTGEDEAALRALAGDDPRIEFLGQVTEEELLDLYAGALVVPFVPVQEDYGLVTIEAFRSRKPVITCLDSGEPTRFVRDFETGFVVEPDPQALADRLIFLVNHPDFAAEMGERGHASVAHISWDRLIEDLVADRPARAGTVLHVDGAGPVPGDPMPAARPPAGRCPLRPAGEPNRQHPPNEPGPYPVAVLDMQPIDPPIGGGRARLLGLYHDLGARLPVTYRGTYDWPGESFRRHRLSDTLEEIDVPLSDAHFAAAAEWQDRAGGKNVIDVSFDQLAHLSPEFLRSVEDGVEEAEIVIFSHPWIYPLVRERLHRDRQLVVYDSQNVEGFLRTALLDDGGLGSDLAEHVAALESELCRAADLILACSPEDRARFHDLYGVPFGKIVIVPNGTFTARAEPPDPDTRARAKRELGLDDRPLIVFLGSAYQPNVEAAEFVARTLAPAVPEATFAILGGVGEACSPDLPRPPNLRITGSLSDDQKTAYLRAADLAVNPMFSGSGTNVKVFDYCAAGLPVVTTPIGARGIQTGAEPAFEVCPAERFPDAVRRLIQDPTAARSLGEIGRRLVVEHYSWERISADLGQRLDRARQRLGQPRPFFSLIIPTYERPDHLRELLDCLRLQTCGDFEVVIVDQSRERWTGASDDWAGLDLLYLHTDVKGAVNARNVGAAHARGEVLAFTDDDCRPLDDWLAKARPRFDDPEVVGVEGLIVSDRRYDPEYRAVTNINFEGQGFMTANLFIRRETFLALDGFDLRFDRPHFREDTDFGWRALELGRIPFAVDVRVYHPPHRRDVEREGHAERNQFFEKDALLLKKHPERYRTLFLHEAHYRQTPGFREHFLRGAEKYDVEIDEFYLTHLAAASVDAALTGGA